MSMKLSLTHIIALFALSLPLVASCSHTSNTVSSVNNLPVTQAEATPQNQSTPTEVNSPVEITPEAKEEARRHPNGHVYVLDGTFGPDERVPPEAIVGAWKVDEHGQITGEFIRNPNYRAASKKSGR